MRKLMKALVAWLVLPTVLFVLVSANASASEIRGHLASVGWLRQNLNNPAVVVVDASPAPVYKKHHIPGAVLSTLFTYGPSGPTQEQVQQQVREWGVGQQHKVVLYDPGGTYMATRLFWDLVHHGMNAEQLVILDGGFSKWQADGGPVSQEATPAPAAGSVQLAPVNADVRVRLPEFLAATADPRRNVMLEALMPNYFFGGAAFFNRGGHVPHATLMPSDDLFNADKTFKSPGEIQRMLDHLGVGREQQVLTYCGGGGAATVPFFALRYLLGYPQVRMFQESQRGWLQDERELPMWTWANPHLLRDTAWLQAWTSPMLRAFGLSQVAIVDVRANEVFQLGHLPAALHVPELATPGSAVDSRAMIALLGQRGVNPAHEAVVVSEGGLNERSALAFVRLERLGQKRVSIYLDSTERWAEAGNEVVRASTAATPTVDASRQVADTVASSGKGLFSHVTVASGPKAVISAGSTGPVLHLPYAQFLRGDGTPKAAHDIWSMLEKAGLPRYAQIDVVGETPGQAAVNYVILRMMGFADVRLQAD